jgi:hypothetical protein
MSNYSQEDILTLMDSESNHTNNLSRYQFVIDPDYMIDVDDDNTEVN